MAAACPPQELQCTAIGESRDFDQLMQMIATRKTLGVRTSIEIFKILTVCPICFMLMI